MEAKRKSNRTIYAENREKYYNEVISMFESGMIAKDIVKVVPIGKSTVYRWYDEYAAANKDAKVRKSPKDAADTIKQLRARVEQLEALHSVGNNCAVVDRSFLIDLKSDIENMASDLSGITDKLSMLAQKLTDKL